MSLHSTALSKLEKRGGLKRVKRNVASPPAGRLLYSREQVAEMLGGVSVHTIRRLEKEGRLRPIRLTRSPSAMVFFRAEDVHALVAEASDV